MTNTPNINAYKAVLALEGANIRLTTFLSGKNINNLFFKNARENWLEFHHLASELEHAYRLGMVDGVASSYDDLLEKRQQGSQGHEIKIYSRSDIKWEVDEVEAALRIMDSGYIHWIDSISIDSKACAVFTIKLKKYDDRITKYIWSDVALTFEAAILQVTDWSNGIYVENYKGEVVFDLPANGKTEDWLE